MGHVGRRLIPVSIACVIFLPFLVSNQSTLRVASLFFVSIILLSGLHVVTGLTRIVSLCHVALMGVGAYASAIAALKFSVWPLAAVVGGALAAGLVAAVIAHLSRHLEDHYLALSTLAASEIITNFFRSAGGLTGGANGLTQVPPLSAAGWALDSPARYYPVCAALGLLALYVVWLLDRSLIGRSLRAMGDEGPLVESLGVKTVTLRSIGFVSGGFLAGLAGAITAHIDGFVGPESFGVSISIACLCFLVIAGLGRLTGVFVGAAFLTILPEVFRSLLEWQMIIVAGTALAILGSTRFRIRTALPPADATTARAEEKAAS